MAVFLPTYTFHMESGIYRSTWKVKQTLHSSYLLDIRHHNFSPDVLVFSSTKMKLAEVLFDLLIANTKYACSS
jgi:hypothetical protein